MGATGPQGEVGATGPQGEAGEAATIAVGTVTTGDPETAAAVENVGTAQAAVFNFTIPRGATGSQGEVGATGPQGEVGATGPQGEPGAAATITPGVAVADATDAEDVITQFNALLTSLRNAGFIANE